MPHLPKKIIVTIPASRQAEMNTLASQDPFDVHGGGFTFTSPLSPDGNSPPTKYWASGRVTLRAWQQIQALVQLPEFADVNVYDIAAGHSPKSVLASEGLHPVSS